MCKGWFFSINIGRYGRFKKIRVRILEFGNIVCMNIYLFLETVAYPMVLCMCVCVCARNLVLSVSKFYLLYPVLHLNILLY